MTSVALISRAGGLGWHWHLVQHDLNARGYDAFAVDLAAPGRTGLPAPWRARESDPGRTTLATRAASPTFVDLLGRSV